MRRFLAFLLLAGPASASVRDALAPLVDLSPSDTVVAVRPADTGTILLDVRGAEGARTLRLSVSTSMRERLCAAADSEGMSCDSAIAARPIATVWAGDQARNRASFNRAQGALGAAAFYTTIGMGVQPSSASTATGLVLLGYPASYLGHYLYGRDKEWTDAHLAGAWYGSSRIYLGAIFGTALLADVDRENSWRAASFVGAAAYPVGLHLGYLYGERRRTEPGRVYLAQSMASQGMFTGTLAPLVLLPWGSDGNARDALRVAGTTGIVGGIGGHVVGDRLFAGRPVAGGTGDGVSTLANLGLLSGLELALLLEPGDERAVAALLLAGNGAGAAAGLAILPDQRDTRERAYYVSGGASLGALTGIAIVYLGNGFEDAEPSAVMAYPTVGAWAGYALATHLTRHLVETARGREPPPRGGPIGGVALSPVVLPMRSESGRRWVWPGLTVSLR